MGEEDDDFEPNNDDMIIFISQPSKFGAIQCLNHSRNCEWLWKPFPQGVCSAVLSTRRLRGHFVQAHREEMLLRLEMEDTTCQPS